MWEEYNHDQKYLKMSTITQRGYLLLADISGYTSFVAGTELEHSQDILSDLLATLCEKIESLLTIHKLEGDAVFAYSPESKTPRGETLLELIESTYTAFRDNQVSMKRATTCTCRACQNIPSLDLKFIAHYGEYIIQHIRDIKELVGSDVNLVHRLLKNRVSESTGWRAYAMFTQPCLEHMQLNLEDTHEQVESYEHLPQVKTFSLDLHKRYKEIIEARRVFVDKDEADALLVCDFNVSSPVAWDWIQDPMKVNLWAGDGVWSSGDRPKGRTGTGASNHCAHGDGTTSLHVVLDWRPFEYSTTESFRWGMKLNTMTTRFEPLANGGTRVYMIMKVEIPLLRPLHRILGKIFTKIFAKPMEEMLQTAARLAKEDYAKSRRELQ
jgi:class 3 adenylate cyclase